MILICHTIALVLIFSFLIQCPGRDFVGITTGYNQDFKKLKSNEANSLISECNENCHCKKDWNPVCDPTTGQIYYSACFAGCTERIKTETGDNWTGCQCLNSSFIDQEANSDLSLQGGFCSRDCGWPMWIFLSLLFFSVIASFASGIPSQQV